MLNKILRYTFTIIGFLAIGACGVLDFHSDKQVSSSLMDYLYPKDKHQALSEEGQYDKPIPHLELPVRVGIAFVPRSTYSRTGLSPQQELVLLDKAKTQFAQYEYIEHIEVIPSNYLQAKGGFTNLKQISRLYDVDLMALVSYDQIQKTYAKDASFLYLTVVGAYVFKGDDNHIQSFMDTAVFDVNSETLLFRAPGLHQARRNSSLNDREKVQDVLSHESFDASMQEMLLNLDQELSRFKTRVKEGKIAKVSYHSGYSGGGSIGLEALLLMLFVLSLRLLKLQAKPLRTYN